MLAPNAVDLQTSQGSRIGEEKASLEMTAVWWQVSVVEAEAPTRIRALSSRESEGYA